MALRLHSMNTLHRA